MPKLTLFFPPEFEDLAWQKSAYPLTVPENERRSVEWVLGRRPDSDLTIAINTVSRRHAAISYSPSSDTWSLQDLGSTRGTFLNGAKLLPEHWHQLQIGDHILLGLSPIYVVEDENDTLGGQKDGPTTILGTKPLDHRTGEPKEEETPETYVELIHLGLVWLLHADTKSGAVVRLVAVAGAAVVAVLIWG